MYKDPNKSGGLKSTKDLFIMKRESDQSRKVDELETKMLIFN